jgi:hypothetical protein
MCASQHRCPDVVEEYPSWLSRMVKMKPQLRTLGRLADTTSSRGHAHADTGSRCLRTFKVRNSVLRLIPNMAVQLTHRLAVLVQAQKSLLLGRIQFHRFGGGQSACHPSLTRCRAALLAQFQFQLGDRGHDAGDGAPSRSAGVHPFPQRPHVDATAGQLVEGGGDFADRASEPVHRDDHEVIAFAEVTLHSVQPGRLLPARPDAVSGKTRSGVMPAAAIASC